MGASKRICPNCGRKMKQQFIGLFHCKCGTSWRRDIGFFERTPDMVFALERKEVGSKVKQLPVIRNKYERPPVGNGWWPCCIHSSEIPRYLSISTMPSPLMSSRFSKAITAPLSCIVRKTGSMASTFPVTVT